MTAKDTLAQWYTSDTPLVFGHRGALADAPMNTLPAFELAYEQGAAGVELDVHFSADNELVIVHDFTVDKTTDSEGKVSDMSLAQLKELDAGSWFSDSFTGTRIPTLNEVFEAVGQKLYINVEIKHLELEPNGLEEAVLACIQEHNLAERVIVSSFNPHVLVRFQKIAPQIPLGYLLYAGSVLPNIDEILPPTHYQAIHYHHEMIDADAVAKAQKHQHRINTWTVNDPDRARELAKMGVDAIITDNPAPMKATFA